MLGTFLKFKSEEQNLPPLTTKRWTVTAKSFLNVPIRDNEIEEAWSLVDICCSGILVT